MERKAILVQRKKIPEAALENAIEKLDQRDLNDGEDVRRELLPDIPGRTVCNVGLLLPHPFLTDLLFTLRFAMLFPMSTAGLKGFAQRTKPALMDRHIQQCHEMYERHESWTVEDVFLKGVLINSNESKVILAISEGRCYFRRRKGQDVMAARNVRI
jgi:hypothetical protein